VDESNENCTSHDFTRNSSNEENKQKAFLKAIENYRKKIYTESEDDEVQGGAFLESDDRKLK
jgi:hypothetical protein